MALPAIKANADTMKTGKRMLVDCFGGIEKYFGGEMRMMGRI